MEPTLRQRQVEEELRSVATSLVGEAPGLLDKVKRSSRSGVSTTGREESEKKSPRQFSADLGLEWLEAHNLHVMFTVFATTSKSIRRREFGKLLVALVRGRSISTSNVSAWWQQVLDTVMQGEEASVSPFLSRFRAEVAEDSRQNLKAPTSAPTPARASASTPALTPASCEGRRKGFSEWASKTVTQKEAAVSFERFATWWARSDLRPSAFAVAEGPPGDAAAAARLRAEAEEADALPEDLGAQGPAAARDGRNMLVNGQTIAKDSPQTV